ncbi:MAG: hypothetical protein KDE48_10070 [Anaerolineales bacterium]|nr:hypothetical protein [Anaerolineales bacterium]
MQTQIQELTMRHSQKDDIDQVLALMQHCDIAEYGESDPDKEDLENYWKKPSLGANCNGLCFPTYRRLDTNCSK